MQDPPHTKISDVEDGMDSKYEGTSIQTTRSGDAQGEAKAPIFNIWPGHFFKKQYLNETSLGKHIFGVAKQQKLEGEDGYDLSGKIQSLGKHVLFHVCLLFKAIKRSGFALSRMFKIVKWLNFWKNIIICPTLKNCQPAPGPIKSRIGKSYRRWSIIQIVRNGRFPQAEGRWIGKFSRSGGRRPERRPEWPRRENLEIPRAASLWKSHS